MDIDKQNFIAYLQKEYPDLYLIEKEKSRLISTSGHGDISIVFKMINGVIEMAEVMGAAKVYFNRKRDNIFEK